MFVFFLRGLGWYIPGHSRPPTSALPPSTTCGKAAAHRSVSSAAQRCAVPCPAVACRALPCAALCHAAPCCAVLRCALFRTSSTRYNATYQVCTRLFAFFVRLSSPGPLLLIFFTKYPSTADQNVTSQTSTQHSTAQQGNAICTSSSWHYQIARCTKSWASSFCPPSGALRTYVWNRGDTRRHHFRAWYIIKTKIHSSCEIEYFVETHLCKLCVILRSRVLRVVCPH